ncbi:MAG: hypothetical protein IPM50_12030 [Acidobacteriota bacterium]|nr:MAG: hypothetical protein IPM50_12030 [Acidobacteriota bacterium]
MSYTQDVNVRRRWEVCERENVESRWTSMYVSLNRLGDIVLNRVAYEQLGEPPAVELLYDRERETIGVKPLNTETVENAFPVRPRGNRGGYRIRGNRLLRDFGIDIGRTRIFPGCQIDRYGVLCLDVRYSKPLGGGPNY